MSAERLALPDPTDDPVGYVCLVADRADEMARWADSGRFAWVSLEAVLAQTALWRLVVGQHGPHPDDVYHCGACGERIWPNKVCPEVRAAITAAKAYVGGGPDA